MFNKKPNYSNGQTTSAGNRKFIIIGIIFVLVVIVVILSSLGGNKSSGESGSGFNTYRDANFSIKYPADYSVAQTTDETGGTSFKPPSSGKDSTNGEVEEGYVISRYSKNSASSSISSIEKLSTLGSVDGSSSIAKTSRTTVNDEAALLVEEGENKKSYYIFGSEYVWLVTFTTGGKSDLGKQIDQIINSFVVQGNEI